MLRTDSPILMGDCYLCGTLLKPPMQLMVVRLDGHIIDMLRIHHSCFQDAGSDWHRIKRMPSFYDRSHAFKIATALAGGQESKKRIINRTAGIPIVIDDLGEGTALRYRVSAQIGENEETLALLYSAPTLVDLARYLMRGSTHSRPEHSPRMKASVTDE